MFGMDYGNTRLRAMRSRLFSSVDYTTMAAADSMDGLLATLTGTAYAVDLEAALARYSGLRRFDEVVRRHMVRVLGSVKGFYSGADRQRVELLLDRWDLENLRAVLRGQAGFQRPDDVLRLVVPVGRLGSAELTELALQPGLRMVIDLMVAWHVPSDTTARRVLDVWPAYEASGNVAILEFALAHAFAVHLDEVLTGDESEAAGVLRAEIDETNVLTALRLRQARIEGELASEDIVSTEHFLPAGGIRLSDVSALTSTEDRSAVVDRLDGVHLVEGWREGIAAWADHDDLVVLTDDMRLASTRHAVGLFRRGDPLGFDVPVAFTRAQEHETKNLRWIARGVAHGLEPAAIERRVVVVT